MSSNYGAKMFKYPSYCNMIGKSSMSTLNIYKKRKEPLNGNILIAYYSIFQNIPYLRIQIVT